MFSASSTVLMATVLTLVTTASLTALACSLVFSATARGLWLALVLLPLPERAWPAQVRLSSPFPGRVNPWLYWKPPAAPFSDSRGALMPMAGSGGPPGSSLRAWGGVWVHEQLGLPVGR